MKILAIDPSLNSTGFAYTQDGTLFTGTIPVKNLRSSARLYYVLVEVIKLLDAIEPDAVIYEDYSMGSRGRVFDIGELGGVLKLEMYGKGTPVVLVPPSTLKQFATGKGNAKKDAMREGLKDNFGYEILQDDEVDAALLYEFGVRYFEKGKSFKYAAKCKYIAGMRCN